MSQGADPTHKTAPAVVQQTPVTVEVREDGAEAYSHGDTHEQMAQAVAKLLRPMIIEAVDKALHKSLHSIHKTIETQAQRKTRAESRWSSVKEDMLDLHS